MTSFSFGLSSHSLSPETCLCLGRSRLSVFASHPDSKTTRSPKHTRQAPFLRPIQSSAFRTRFATAFSRVPDITSGPPVITHEIKQRLVRRHYPITPSSEFFATGRSNVGWPCKAIAVRKADESKEPHSPQTVSIKLFKKQNPS